MIGFEWIKVFDCWDYVVVKFQVMNMFEVKGGLLEVGVEKYVYQVVLCDFFLFYFWFY